MVERAADDRAAADRDFEAALLAAKSVNVSTTALAKAGRTPRNTMQRLLNQLQDQQAQSN